MLGVCIRAIFACALGANKRVDFLQGVLRFSAYYCVEIYDDSIWFSSWLYQGLGECPQRIFLEFVK